MLSLVEIGPVVLEKINFINVFLLFRNYFPLDKGVVLHWNKVESPTPRKYVPSLIENGSMVLEKKIFNFVIDFHHFNIISPWKRAGPFI